MRLALNRGDYKFESDYDSRKKRKTKDKTARNQGVGYYTIKAVNAKG